MAVYSVLIKEVLWAADQQILFTCWSGCEDSTCIPRGGQQGIGSEGRQIQRTGPFRNSLGDRQTSQEQDTKITASDQKSGDLCNNGFGDGKRSWGYTAKAALQRAGGGCTLSTLFTLAELTHWRSSAGSHWALLEAAIPPPQSDCSECQWDYSRGHKEFPLSESPWGKSSLWPPFQE